HASPCRLLGNGVTVGAVDDETTLVICGATGDLSSRLLLPALGQLMEQEPDRHVRLIGAGTQEWSDEDLLDVVRTALESADAAAAMERVQAEYRRADITKADDLQTLLSGIE